MSDRKITRRIIVHHEGNGTYHDGTLAGIHAYHKKKGWQGIAYHYLIGSDGRLYIGRHYRMIGTHAYANNSDSIGICLLGDKNLRAPTLIQWARLLVLIRWIASAYNISSDHVIGHRETGRDTDCPGKYIDLPRLRQLVKWYMGMSRAKPKSLDAVEARFGPALLR